MKTTIKKYLAAVLSFCMIISVFTCLTGVTVFATDDPRAVVESKTVNPGDTFTVSVELENVEPMSSLALSAVTYNETVMTMSKATLITDGSESIKSWNKKKNQGAVAYEEPTDINGKVLEITFVMSAEAPEGDYQVTLACQVANNAAPAEVTVVPGTVKIDHDYSAVVTQPTCTEQGYTTHTCSRCGNVYVDTYTDALGHTFGEWTETVAPTCTEKGEEKHTCGICGAFETRDKDALGHNYEAVITPSTCTEQGYTTHTCSRCKDTYVDTYTDPNGHTFGDWIETVAPTCTAKGEEKRTCGICGAFETRDKDALGHDIIHHDAKAATCTEKGWKAYDTCSRCDYTTYEEIAALGHDIIHHDAKAATCTEKGWKAYDTCSRCDYTTYEEIAALGHDIIHHDAKAATCTEKGWKAYDTCSRCDYTTYEETQPLGHDIIHHDAKAATCTEKGWKAYDTCSRCDYTTYEEITALGHDWQEAWTIDETNHWHVCSRCEEVNEQGEHTYGEWEITKPATSKETGIRTKVCTVCGKEINEEIAKIGDVNGDGQVTDQDAVYLLFNTFFADDYPLNQEGDFNGDGLVTDQDAIYLLFFTFFPDDYPIC